MIGRSRAETAYPAFDLSRFDSCQPRQQRIAVARRRRRDQVV
jgi:hypothetical protein